MYTQNQTIEHILEVFTNKMRSVAIRELLKAGFYGINPHKIRARNLQRIAHILGMVTGCKTNKAFSCVS